jgi:hypothetical protein
MLDGPQRRSGRGSEKNFQPVAQRYTTELPRLPKHIRKKVLEFIYAPGVCITSRMVKYRISATDKYFIFTDDKLI